MVPAAGRQPCIAVQGNEVAGQRPALPSNGLAEGLGQIAVGLLLRLVGRGRRHDLDFDDLVALRVARQATPAQAQLAAGIESAGIFSSTAPPRVGTLMLVPSAACHGVSGSV